MKQIYYKMSVDKTNKGILLLYYKVRNFVK